MAKVSVVIPNYNGENFLRQAIQSICRQTYTDWEILVVDDGSKDGSLNVLAELQTQIPPDKLRVFAEPHLGASHALNRGLRQAKGEYVCWLSVDDEFLPEKLAKQVKRLDEDPALAMIYSGFLFMDCTTSPPRISTILGKPFGDLWELMINNVINGSSIMVRREIFNEIGYFDEALQADADFDMWARMILRGLKIGFDPEPLIVYRWHQGNQSHQLALMNTYNDFTCSRLLAQSGVGKLSQHEIKGLVQKLLSSGLYGASRTAALLLPAQSREIFWNLMLLRAPIIRLAKKILGKIRRVSPK